MLRKTIYKNPKKEKRSGRIIRVRLHQTHISCSNIWLFSFSQIQQNKHKGLACEATPVDSSIDSPMPTKK